MFELRAGEVLSDAYWVEASETISSVVGTMKEKGIYEVFVKTKDKYAMVTLRSILSKRSLNAKLSEVMVRVPN